MTNLRLCAVILCVVHVNLLVGQEPSTQSPAPSSIMLTQSSGPGQPNVIVRPATQIPADRSGDRDVGGSVSPDTPSTSKPLPQDLPDIVASTPTLAVEIAGPEAVNVNQRSTYVVAIKNLGRSAAEEVRLRIALPELLRVYDASLQPRRDETGALLFDLGQLAPEAARQVQLDVVPTATGEVKLNCSVAFSTSLRTTLKVHEPELQLSCQVDGDAVVGRPFQLRLLVTNAGAGFAEGIVVEPLLPPSWALKPQVKALRVGGLGSGQSRELFLQVQAPQAGPGELRFRALAGTGAEVSARIEVLVKRPWLNAQMLGPAVTFLQREDVYEVHVTNMGDAPVRNVEIACVLPRGLQVTVLGTPAKFDPRNNSLHTHIDELPERVTDILRFKAKALQPGQQTQKLMVRSGEGLSAGQQLTTNVLSRSNVHMTLANRHGATEVGEVATMDVVLINSGTRGSEATTIVVELPKTLKPLSSAGYEIDGQELRFSPFLLTAGQRRALSFEITSEVAGDHQVRVLVRSPDFSQPIAAEGNTFFYKSRQTADARSDPPPPPQEPARVGARIP